MLKLYVPPKEWFDEKKNEFVSFDGAELKLEHSLAAIAEWEMKWEKSFLKNYSDKKITKVEFLDYVRCMTLNEVNGLVYLSLSNKNIQEIGAYLGKRNTATWFSQKEGPQKRNSETITSELIYYWMTEYGIPFSCDKWNFNRLMTLIEVCNRKNASTKKRDSKSILADQARLNAERRKRLNTSG